ncbi:MAG: M20/M25/M40 family metallo-hydrolase [Bacteroidales bacterium]|nr:M20/M25/M40 family metallo-hydrolase [Bacteroidales bacterium]
MTRKVYIPVFLTLFLCASNLTGQESPVEKGLNAISLNAIKAQLGFLASDWTEGRETGQKGEYISGDYIASMLQLYGVKPFGDYPQGRGFSGMQMTSERTYFQNFVIIKTQPGEQQVLKLKTKEGETVKYIDLVLNVDYTLRPTGQSIEIEAPVVFTGYGLKSDKLKINDLGKTDVKGKFILKISGAPAFAREKLTPSELSAASREFENSAMSMGAAGIIEFSPESVTAGTGNRPEFLNMAPSEISNRPSQSGARYSLPSKNREETFPRIYLSASSANELLKGTGINIGNFMRKAGNNESYTLPVITGKSVYLKSEVITTPLQARNVLGIIEGNNPEEIIVLGAHYDHLGMHDGYIWNGADDNGSGTVGVMTLAKAPMETGQKPEKTIIIALWTGEELGLLGSRYFISNSGFPVRNIKLNVNFDMISRYISDDDTKKVIMTYTKSFPAFRSITEENIQKHGIDLSIEYQPSDDPPGGSDHRNFVSAGIPVMRFKPGHREEYHTPDDETNSTDWDIMEKIIKLSFANIWYLANNKW